MKGMINDQNPMTKQLKNPIIKILAVALAGVLIVVGIFIASLIPAGEREVSSVENIDGIPYPMSGDAIQVSERLAHADLYLNQPALAKELDLTITFSPHNLESLAVGVRDNSFWLSYDPVVLFESGLPTTNYNLQTKKITIPLTDKLQETDQSLDLMFFATTSGEDPVSTPGVVTAWIDDRVNDGTYWELHDVRAEVRTVPLTGLQNSVRLADWVASVIRRERAL